MSRHACRIVLQPATRDQVGELVTRWHRHHRRPKSARFGCIALVDGEPIGGVLVGNPGAPALSKDPTTLEVTRLVLRGGDRNAGSGDRNAGSMLLGAVWRASKALGAKRLVSYVRVDETGSVYKAAGWEAVATTPARDWTRERHLLLPGVIEPASDPVARVRWEITT